MGLVEPGTHDCSVCIPQRINANERPMNKAPNVRPRSIGTFMAEGSTAASDCKSVSLDMVERKENGGCEQPGAVHYTYWPISFGINLIKIQIRDDILF